MANPAFSSRSDCPIPFVPEIVPELIQDCEIPPIPDPFFEMNIVPPFIPPIVVGCPPISVSARASRVLNKNFPLKFSASASTYDPAGDNCFPEIDLKLWVPFACPDMSVVNQSPKIAQSPSYMLQVTRNVDNAPDCEYEFDLDITFVCTSMSVRSQQISRVKFDDPPSLEVNTEVDWEHGCNIDFDIKIDIPALEGVDTDCSDYDGLIVGGDLYVEDNILYWSCSKVPVLTDTFYNGSGGCLDYISLSYDGHGFFGLHVGKTSCSVVYC